MMLESTACNRSHRSRKTALLLPLIIVVPAFILIMVRLYSIWVMGCRFERDDYVMMVCGVSTPCSSFSSHLL
jgi:hypothetical protein